MKKLILLFAPLLINAQSWNLSGNSSTNESSNFIGTTDNQSLVFKTNNIEWLKIKPTGRFIYNNIDSAPGWDSNLLFGGGNDILTSKGNTAFGVGSFVNASTGGYNTAIGTNSLRGNISGFNNTGLGTNSLMNNIAGSQNTGIGENALGLAKGKEKTAIGSHALYGDSNGDNNTAIGGYSLRGVQANASNNTAIGAQSFLFLRTGTNNIAIGYNTASIELTNASNSIYIGANVQPTNSSPINELNIGNWIYGKNGTIGIGTSNVTCTNCTGYKLFVKDGIKTEKIKVEFANANGWADYVFEQDYKLLPLKDLKDFISVNKHLPEVPTAQNVVDNGLELKEFNALLLKKIEELTLHIIKLNENIEKQDKRINQLENIK